MGNLKDFNNTIVCPSCGHQEMTTAPLTVYDFKFNECKRCVGTYMVNASALQQYVLTLDTYEAGYEGRLHHRIEMIVDVNTTVRRILKAIASSVVDRIDAVDCRPLEDAQGLI